MKTRKNMSGLLALSICAATFTYGSSNEANWSTSFQSNPLPIVCRMDLSTASVIISHKPSPFSIPGHEPESTESPSSIPGHEPESTDSVQNALDTTTDQKEHKDQTLPQDLAHVATPETLDFSAHVLGMEEVTKLINNTTCKTLILDHCKFMGIAGWYFVKKVLPTMGKLSSLSMTDTNLTSYELKQARNYIAKRPDKEEMVWKTLYEKLKVEKDSKYHSEQREVIIGKAYCVVKKGAVKKGAPIPQPGYMWFEDTPQNIPLAIQLVARRSQGMWLYLGKKLNKTEQSDVKSYMELLDEKIHIVTKATHDKIMKLYDFGDEDDIDYLCHELVSGDDEVFTWRREPHTCTITAIIHIAACKRCKRVVFTQKVSSRRLDHMLTEAKKEFDNATKKKKLFTINTIELSSKDQEEVVEFVPKFSELGIKLITPTEDSESDDEEESICNW